MWCLNHADVDCSCWCCDCFRTSLSLLTSWLHSDQHKHPLLQRQQHAKEHRQQQLIPSNRQSCQQQETWALTTVQVAADNCICCDDSDLRNAAVWNVYKSSDQVWFGSTTQLISYECFFAVCPRHPVLACLPMCQVLSICEVLVLVSLKPPLTLYKEAPCTLINWRVSTGCITRHSQDITLYWLMKWVWGKQYKQPRSWEHSGRWVVGGSCCVLQPALQHMAP